MIKKEKDLYEIVRGDDWEGFVEGNVLGRNLGDKE